MEAATAQLSPRIVLGCFLVANEARGKAVTELVRYSNVGGLRTEEMETILETDKIPSGN